MASQEPVLLTVHSGAEEPGNEVSLSVQMFSKLTSMVSLKKGNCLVNVGKGFISSVWTLIVYYETNNIPVSL